MKKFYFILIMLASITFVSCESNDEKNIRLKKENKELRKSNSDLRYYNYNLSKSIKNKRSTIAELDEKIRIKNLQKKGKKVRFFVTIEIKQTTYTLDFEEHIKNSLNRVEMTIETTDNMYYSVKKGQELSSNFKEGSFLVDGDFSELNITVKNKYTK